MEPFSIAIPDRIVEDLRSRLANTRWPSSLAGQGWTRGMDLEILRDLCHYWGNDFDWRAQERQLNGFNQIMINLDGINTHAIHVRSQEPDALPLLLTHGWPGTFAEFRHIIGPLTNPRAHGHNPRDAFHVVAPSLPGYGFSEPARAPGFDIRAVGKHLEGLMAALGYERFCAQGGDWGAMATHCMAADMPERLYAIHLNLAVVYPPQSDNALTGLSALELSRVSQAQAFQNGDGALYSMIQGMTPHTLSPAISDSPAGLAAWISEKFHRWSDHRGNLEDAISRDDLLTHLTLYWATNSFGSSIELYWESMQANTLGPPPLPVTVPTGLSVFPRELLIPPRRWAEDVFNLHSWVEHDRGGHFPAMEQPALLIDDIRNFFRSFRTPQ